MLFSIQIYHITGPKIAPLSGKGSSIHRLKRMFSLNCFGSYRGRAELEERGVAAKRVKLLRLARFCPFPDFYSSFQMNCNSITFHLEDFCLVLTSLLISSQLNFFSAKNWVLCFEIIILQTKITLFVKTCTYKRPKQLIFSSLN